MRARATPSRLDRLEHRMTERAAEIAAAAEERRAAQREDLGRLIMTDPIAREIAIDFSDALRPHGSSDEWVRTDPVAVRLGEKLIERVTELGGSF